MRISRGSPIPYRLAQKAQIEIPMNLPAVLTYNNELQNKDVNTGFFWLPVVENRV